MESSAYLPGLFIGVIISTYLLSLIFGTIMTEMTANTDLSQLSDIESTIYGVLDFGCFTCNAISIFTLIGLVIIILSSFSPLMNSHHQSYSNYSNSTSQPICDTVIVSEPESNSEPSSIIEKNDLEDIIENSSRFRIVAKNINNNK